MIENSTEQVRELVDAVYRHRRPRPGTSQGDHRSPVGDGAPGPTSGLGSIFVTKPFSSVKAGRDFSKMLLSR